MEAHSGQHDALIGEIRDFMSAYVEAVNSADLPAIAEYYAPESAFHWVENGAIAYDSHQAVATAFERLEGSVTELRLTLGEPRIEPLGPRVAAVTASYAQTVVDQSGTHYETQGMLTGTLVRRNGAWKFLSGHVSQQRPPADGS